MDKEKLEFFVSRYRGVDADEIMSLLARTESLAEEAQAALLQVAEERSIVFTEAIASQIRREQLVELPAKTIEERSFSREAADSIHEKKVLFLWSIPIGFGSGIVYRLLMPKLGTTILASAIFLVGVLSIVWSLYCLYRLSRSIDPSRSVAWTMVGTQFIPIIGWISAISLVLKAGRIKRLCGS
jgi:hypothetical protein